MTNEEYLAKCEEVPKLLDKEFPVKDGWRYVLVLRNEPVNRWATAKNIDKDGAIELLAAALAICEAKGN